MPPVAPPSRCPCGAPTQRGDRCDACRPRPKPWAKRSRNAAELSGRQRQRIRDQQLAREPQCRQCGSTEQLEPDHIIPVAEGGALYDSANLQTLCAPHHLVKTLEEARRGRLRAARRG